MPVGIPAEAEPAASNAPLEAITCRIVDFGDDYQWRVYFPRYRDSYTFNQTLNLNLDGGATSNDSMESCDFSLEKPLNQIPGSYNLEGNNAVFYGGGVGIFYNKDPRLSECAINENHNGLDDFNWHAYATEADTGVRTFVTWLWKKEDFMNNGASNTVAFGADSILAVRVTRYWEAYDEGRFVVQHNGQFYLSEYAFGSPTNDSTYKVYNICPTNTRWAAWNPSGPANIEYDPDELTFQTLNFTNVECVGWIAAKLEPTQGSCWLKWAAFEAHGTVTRPQRLSEELNMRNLSTPSGDAYLSETEISYRSWRKVYKWAARNQWALTPGYVFAHAGSMGSMEFGEQSHEITEPVTDISWYDAILWCNALSEYEGRTPCYYTDATFTNVLRCVQERQEFDQWDWRPEIYVDWSADGYRLPVAEEWNAAFAAGSPALSIRSTGTTHTVRSQSADAAGLRDLIGNVWEWIWHTDGASHLPQTNEDYMVLGGDFMSTTGGVCRLPYGEQPDEGNYNIGFRVIRRNAGASDPSTDTNTLHTSIPRWTVQRGEALLPETPAQPATSPEMIAVESGTLADYGTSSPYYSVSVLPFEMGRTELSYAKWKDIRQWAEMSLDYQFNYRGAMGSMADALHQSHSPDEPVAGISMIDAMLWCNALSEQQGRTPVYYEPDGITVLRTSHPFRHNMYVTDDPDVLNPGFFCDAARATNVRDNFLTMKWEADGYRLPTDFEWQYAAQAGGASVSATYPATNDTSLWVYGNTGGRTKSVGTSSTNAWGFYDLIGNVWEWSSAPHAIDRADRVNPRSDHANPAVQGGSYTLQDNRRDRPLLSSRTVQRQNVLWMVAPALNAYAEIGFRPARADAGVQPVEHTAEARVQLAIDTRAVHALQGTMHRGNNRRTGWFQANGITNFSGVRWTFETGAEVESSPVVVGDQLFIGSHNGRFYALDKTTGQTNWVFESGDIIRSSAAVYSNRIVFFVSNDETLYALDAQTGAELWSKSSASVWGDYGMGTSPLIIDDIVFCNGDYLIRGYNVHTGSNVWEAVDTYRCAGLGSLTYGNGILFVPRGSIGNRGQDIHTGASIYYDIAGGDTVQATSASDDRFLYTLGGDGFCKYVADDSSARSFAFSTNDWDANHPHFSPAAIDADRFYGGNADDLLYAVDKTSGTLAWSFTTGGPVYSGPSVAGGVVYAGSEDGMLYALDSSSGTELWHYDTGAPITWSAPWLENDAVYVANSSGTVFCLYGEIEADGGEDTDGDSLPDAWEQQHFGGLFHVYPDAEAPNNLNTLLECYIAGIDPADPQAALRLHGSENSISWNAVSGRVYTLYWSTNLLNGFQTLETNLTTGVFSNNASDSGSAFYKLEVQLGPDS